MAAGLLPAGMEGREHAQRRRSVVVIVKGVGQSPRWRAEGGVDTETGEGQQHRQNGDGDRKTGGAAAGIHGGLREGITSFDGGPWPGRRDP